MATAIAASAVPLWQRPERWQPLAVLACGMVALTLLATLTRRSHLLAAVASFSVLEEVIALGLGAGYDLRAGLFAVLLFTAMDLGYWACDTTSARVEAAKRIRALMFPATGALATAIVVAVLSRRGAASSLPTTATGLIAAGGCVALIAGLAIGGGRLKAITAGVAPTVHDGDAAVRDHLAMDTQLHGDRRNP